MLTALLALVGNLFYVLVYTRWLKRSTPQNIVIGGAAGAVPPLVGYAAATGDLGLPALWLFLIVFLWTPPHFWALALLIKENYAAAKVPMLPVVRGEARDDAPDRPLLRRHRRASRSPSGSRSARSTPLPRPLLGASSSGSPGSSGREPTPPARGRPLPLLPPLPGAALRRGGRRPGDPVTDMTPELERKNLILGWALFGLFVLLFAGTVAVAYLYLALD